MNPFRSLTKVKNKNKVVAVNKLIFNGREINVVHKDVKHSYLRVKLDGSITLTIHPSVSVDKLKQILERHWVQLESKIKIMAENKPKMNQLGNGAPFYFLGRCYTLSIKKSKLGSGVVLRDGVCYVTAVDDEPQIVQKVLRSWLEAQSLEILTEQYHAYLPTIQHWQVKSPNLLLRKMSARWGSYNSRTNTVTLNKVLVRAEPDLINYVIAHELCHIMHHDHSKNFYALLATICPAWREYKKKLNSTLLHYGY